MSSLRTTPPPNITLVTKAQRRARIKPDLKSKLEEEYQRNPKPNKQEKHTIALEFSMSDDNVHFWFQNRRARESREVKKQKVSSDQGSSGSNPSSSTQPQLNLDTSSSTNQIKQNNFTVIPHLIDSRPRLPSIDTLIDGQSSTNSPPASTAADAPPYLLCYFHHPPFGIQYTYSKTQPSQFPPLSQ